MTCQPPSLNASRQLTISRTSSWDWILSLEVTLYGVRPRGRHWVHQRRWGWMRDMIVPIPFDWLSAFELFVLSFVLNLWFQFFHEVDWVPVSVWFYDNFNFANNHLRFNFCQASQFTSILSAEHRPTLSASSSRRPRRQYRRGNWVLPGLHSVA